MEIVLIIGAAVVGLGVMIFAIVSLRREREVAIDERLGRYASEYTSAITTTDVTESGSSSRSLVGSDALRHALDSTVEGSKFDNKWKQQLARADLNISTGEFLMLHFVAMIAFFIIGYFTVAGGNIILSVIAGLVGLVAPRFYVANRIGRRLIKFENQLADNLQMWVNGLRSGYSVMQAMEAISREAPEPTAGEFRRVVQEVQLGISMEDALHHMLDRLPSEDLDLVVTAVNIQREVGGNLAEILEIIGHTIRERIKLKGEIRVLTAQGRITGYIIALTPVLLLGFLMTVNPGYVGQLFEHRLCGWPMLGCGATMISIGAAAIQRIVDIQI